MTIVENNPFNLLNLYPETDNIDVLCDQLSDLKKCLDSFRPLSIEQVKHLNELFDTEYTYESNRIEGNTLTLSRTQVNDRVAVLPFKSRHVSKIHTIPAKYYF